MIKVVILSFIFFSSVNFAKQPINIFVKHEFNSTDYITGFGAAATIGNPHSLMKGELITSLNYAEVLDERGNMQDFISLDTGVRLGYYGKVFVYIEAGFDAFEIFLDNARDDDHFYNSDQNNAIDGYAGLGAGINAKNMRVEGFIKARQLDGDNWDSDKQVFYGLQFSLSF